jgi:hypothetical protein
VLARAVEILRYFWLHPNRVDDLESVARWRLLEETIHYQVEEIREALGWLVAEGFLVQNAVGRSRSVFRLNQEQLAATERFLQGTGQRRKTNRRRGDAAT